MYVHNFPLPCGASQGNYETTNLNESNRLVIPTGRRPTNWLRARVTQGVELGITETNPIGVKSVT